MRFPSPLQHRSREADPVVFEGAGREGTAALVAAAPIAALAGLGVAVLLQKLSDRVIAIEVLDRASHHLRSSAARSRVAPFTLCFRGRLGLRSLPPRLFSTPADWVIGEVEAAPSLSDRVLVVLAAVRQVDQLRSAIEAAAGNERSCGRFFEEIEEGIRRVVVVRPGHRFIERD